MEWRGEVSGLEIRRYKEYLCTRTRPPGGTAACCYSYPGILGYPHCHLSLASSGLVRGGPKTLARWLLAANDRPHSPLCGRLREGVVNLVSALAVRCRTPRPET